MKVRLVQDDIDRHGEGCDCGLCNAVGKSYGVGIFPENDPDNPLERIYRASEESAGIEARQKCEQEGWEILSEEDAGPQFIHDCKFCEFLGRYDHPKDDDDDPEGTTPYDLYACDLGGRITVIARYGDDGPEYLSGLACAVSGTALYVAASRAIERMLELVREKKEKA